MNGNNPPRVAIVDYQAGNLYSVEHACRCAGMEPWVTSDPKSLSGVAGVILPGVGAFGDAMRALRDSGLADALIDFSHSGRPLIGICLGMQLLLGESHEFGRHRGLELIEGEVRRLQISTTNRAARVPHVGWSRIYPATRGSQLVDWAATPLNGIEPGQSMYFVHSYVVCPAQRDLVVAESVHGDTVFCSALRRKNVWAFQFHPEKSGPRGIQLYRNIAGLFQADTSMPLAGESRDGSPRRELRHAA
ncbi:MAG: imidazole glycerol phosphate synthase subunit HisH [Planctomycetes bacterium]|nr:imidazole glycerol phosphate synthase subunit HisH [Planctomycetota bacterium]